MAEDERKINSEQAQISAEEMDQDDPCVCCGKPSGEKKGTHIGQRLYYVEGAGQLCKKCYNAVYGPKRLERRFRMKVFRKVFKVLLIVFLATVWLNVGYYVEKSKHEADVKYLSGGGAKLNTLEKFQLGPDRYYAPKDLKEITIQANFLWRGLFILLWPVAVLAWVGAWMVKGIIIAALAAWYGLVWLFRFVFCGGFFRLIGPIGVALVMGSMVFVFLVRRSIRRHNRAKPEE